jgi:hypothetical protein
MRKWGLECTFGHRKAGLLGHPTQSQAEAGHRRAQRS